MCVPFLQPQIDLDSGDDKQSPEEVRDTDDEAEGTGTELQRPPPRCPFTPPHEDASDIDHRAGQPAHTDQQAAEHPERLAGMQGPLPIEKCFSGTAAHIRGSHV